MIRNFFQEKYLIWIIAVFIGILMIAPSFYFRYFGGAYRGIDFFGSDAETAYLAQVQEIYDGHWSLGNIYLSDLKDSPYVQQPLSPIIVAFLGKAAGISARDINMAAKFLFPALLTVLVYACFSAIFGRKDIAIVMAVFVMLIQASWAFLNPLSWPKILLQGEFPGTEPSFLLYARPINPQISSFFFFGYLLCLWKFLFEELDKKSEKIFGIASAVILGLSVYTYFFTLTILAALTGILGIWFFALKDWQKLKKLVLVSFGGGLVAVPYFFNAVKVLASPFYERVIRAGGTVEGRQFIFSRVWWGVFLAFLFLYRKWNWTKIFTTAFLLAGFLVTNQQLLTARTAPVVSHYHWYYIAPVGGAILVYLFLIYLEKFSAALSRWAIIGMILAFLYAGVVFQKNSYDFGHSYIVDAQRYAPLFSWINKNIPEESAFFANDPISNHITAYTGHNVYYDPKVNHYLVGEERLRDSFYAQIFLSGINQENISYFSEENRDLIGNWLFGQYYRMKNGCYGCFPEEILENFVSGYGEFLDAGFIYSLKKYPIDYFIWDKEKNPEWQPNRFLNGKIYEADSFVIYKIS